MGCCSPRVNVDDCADIGFAIVKAWMHESKVMHAVARWEPVCKDEVLTATSIIHGGRMYKRMYTGRGNSYGGDSKRRRAVVLLALGSLLMAACSNSSDSTKTAATSKPAAVTNAPTVSDATVTTDASVATDASDTTDGSATTDAPVTTDAPAPEGPDLGEFQPITGVPGVSDKEIKFAVLGTGPSNPLGYCLLECYDQGVQAYFNYRNSLGGVHGRQLVVADLVDDELGNTQVKLLELISGDDFGIFAAPLIAAGFSDVAAAGVPLYTTNVPAAESNGFDSIFQATGTTCIDCPSRLNVQAAVLAGATKVGSIGYGVSQASKDCVKGHADAFAKWGPAVGIEQVYSNAELPFGLPNGLGPEVTAMKEAGVDFVLTCVDSNGALTLEQELERQGMGDIPIVLPQGYSETAFVSTNADLLEGDLMSVFFHPFEADPNAMLATYAEWMKKAGYAVNDYGAQGWINADLAVTGLLAAGPQFDQAGVISATNKITDYSAGGMIAPVDWTKQHNAPTLDDPLTNAPALFCASFVAIRGGKFELFGDPAKPWFCFDPKVAEWVDATPTAF